MSQSFTRGRLHYTVAPRVTGGWTVEVEGETHVVKRDPSAICLARTRSGRLCEQWQVKGRGSGRCRNHGGLSLSGPEHPTYKHGLHSKMLNYLPGRMKEIREELDDDLIAGLKDVALTLHVFLRRYLELLDDDEAILEDDTLKNLLALAQRLESMTGTYISAQSKLALTEAELTLLHAQVLGLFEEFIRPEDRPRFLRNLRQVLPAPEDS